MMIGKAIKYGAMGVVDYYFLVTDNRDSAARSVRCSNAERS